MTNFQVKIPNKDNVVLEYNTMIKTRCVCSGCKNELPGTQGYYEMHGNYCLKCINQINKKLGYKEIKSSFRNKLIKAGLLVD